MSKPVAAILACLMSSRGTSRETRDPIPARIRLWHIPLVSFGRDSRMSISRVGVVSTTDRRMMADALPLRSPPFASGVAFLSIRHSATLGKSSICSDQNPESGLRAREIGLARYGNRPTATKHENEHGFSITERKSRLRCDGIDRAEAIKSDSTTNAESSATSLRSARRRQVPRLFYFVTSFYRWRRAVLTRGEAGHEQH